MNIRHEVEAVAGDEADQDRLAEPPDLYVSGDEWEFAEQDGQDWLDAEREVQHLLGIADEFPADW